MIYRIAKKKDAKRIAEIQQNIKSVNDLGIFCHMGKGFLETYYRILIEDPQTIFLCAENHDGLVCGYCFNVLDAKKQTENMRNNKIRLGFSAVASMVKKPSLIKELFLRYKSLNNTDETYLHTEGAHAGYWGWDPAMADADASFHLHELSYLIAKNIGVSILKLEVDKENKRIYKFHKLNGAVTEREFTLPDGRVRAFMYYDLSKHKFRI